MDLRETVMFRKEMYPRKKSTIYLVYDVYFRKQYCITLSLSAEWVTIQPL